MFVESLESRSLMSVSAFSTQVQTDRLNVQSALLKFRSDIVADTGTLITDCSALQANDVKKDTTLAPLFKQLHKDVKSMRTTLLEDRLAEKSAVLKDESAVVAEHAQLLKDLGNATARKADRKQLKADRITLQNDEIAGLNSRLATRQAEDSTLSTDLSNITTALGTDTGASPALTAAVNTFVTDRTAILAGIETDLKSIISARSQLVVDLTASESLT